MPLAPVPAIADADRYVSYSPVVLTTQFNITFPLFGDGTDIRVVINGVTQTSGYTVLSPSGTLANLPRPVTDAYVSLSVGISSGTLEIYGNRRPRRTVQATAAYSTRDFNVVFSDLISNMRELWSQFTRAIQVPIGEASVVFPSAASRASKILAFDSAGAPVPVDPSVGGLVTAASISDSTTIGRALITAPNTASAQATIGATTDGIALLTAASKAAQRTQLQLGTAALVNTGVGAGNAIVLDGSAKLPAVDGSLLTGVVAAGGNVLNYQVFTATGAGTWTKPGGLSGNESVIAQMWGAGAGGGNVAGAGGGGGGAYVEARYRASDLNATEAVSVGTGGASGVAGGNTTFKGFTAYGGGTAAGNAGGGGGGGLLTAGGASSGATGGSGGAPAGAAGGNSNAGFGGAGGGSSGGGGNSFAGGAGGGAGTFNGGSSIYGGAGGGGSNAVTSGGTSVVGGAGGAGSATNGAAGSAPGGGGGGGNTTGGAGARGEIRIYVIRVTSA